tara:strand:- start:15346 stop:16110 length:765 start_codon:yes stop_codon:yes gene_type:complete
MILANNLEGLNKWYGSIHAENNWARIQILTQIEFALGLTFVPEPFDATKAPGGNVCMAHSPEVRNEYKITFGPIELLDYIYAVLHSIRFREKFKQHLKIDFSKVPSPKETETFWQMVFLGGGLRQLHLLEFPKGEEYCASYPIEGDNTITRQFTETSPGFEPDDSTFAGDQGDVRGESPIVFGKVWINDKQYFDRISQKVWECYIGHYQPAQKWLKDHRGITLSYEDILHYQKICAALNETQRLIREIDAFEIG